MSFLKIKDPARRERIVKEFLEIKKNIRANELAEKTGKIELREDLSELFKPVTETQKAAAKEITEGLRPIKEGIEQLPQRLQGERRPFLPPFTFFGRPPTTPPPAYMTPAPSEADPEEETEETEEIFYKDTDFGLYNIKNKNFMGDKEMVLKKIGDTGFINIAGEEDYYKKKFMPGLFKLLTSKEYDENNKIYTSTDVQNYRDLLVKTNTMYVDDDPETKKLKTKPKGMSSDKWRLINSTWKRQEVQEKLKKGKTGKGLKKVVLPSDRNALLERLDLLMASKAAGNTGLRNELVSVCDELKRQGIIGNKSYKK